uniref:Voltage-dependent P/Q-type calcium channel subunit alpha-1A-like n=1 Tax=Parastrongyloides trichosuri TaxID=131310 RepID=A0A0N4ZL07_PARTI
MRISPERSLFSRQGNQRGLGQPQTGRQRGRRLKQQARPRRERWRLKSAQAASRRAASGSALKNSSSEPPCGERQRPKSPPPGPSSPSRRSGSLERSHEPPEDIRPAGRDDSHVYEYRLSDWRLRRHDDRSGCCGRHELLQLLEFRQDGAEDVPRPAGGRDPPQRRGARLCRRCEADGAGRRPAPAQHHHHSERPAQRLRHGTQSSERGGGGDDGPAGHADARGDSRGDGARAGACEEPRHTDHDNHRNPCRCDFHAR